MAERCIFDDYALRGAELEVWVEGDNWYLVARSQADADKCGVPAKTVLVGDEFKPPLTAAEIQAIHEAVDGWYAD